MVNLLGSKSLKMFAFVLCLNWIIISVLDSFRAWRDCVSFLALASI
jgi:hypothetical protein